MLSAEKHCSVLAISLLLIVSSGAYGEWFPMQNTDQNSTDTEQESTPMAKSDALNPTIDIIPNDAQNQFDPSQQSSLDVVILGSSDFDVNSIDPATIQLDKIPADSNFQIVDSNQDGIDDLLLQFPVANMTLNKGFVELTLIGKTKDGKDFESNGMIYITATD